MTFEGNRLGELQRRLSGTFYARQDNGGTLDYVPHKWRYVYRIGGIVMLVITLRLAGVI